jgi:membrane protease YdiL (CAAX protease family)
VLSIAVMILGAVGAVLAWQAVVRRGISIWVAMSGAGGLAGLLALATGQVPLSPKVEWPLAASAGLGAGVALYLATTVFVAVVSRWPVFDRHVAQIYAQRRGLPLGPTLFLASGVNAPGEELFWRGLFESRLARTFGWPAAAALTWGAYLAVNLASQNLPIVAGAVVAGGVWSCLALWTHGVVASLVCHSVWTGLMLAFPPGAVRTASVGPHGAAR